MYSWREVCYNAIMTTTQQIQLEAERLAKLASDLTDLSDTLFDNARSFTRPVTSLQIKRLRAGVRVAIRTLETYVTTTLEDEG